MAAEIIIEEGVSDYLYAKKKAAKYLNYNLYQILPSNNEIDEAIRDYQATFPSNNVADFIFYQDIAIKIMSELEPFNPLITGTLKEGRVTNNQKILINLFTDNFKEIEYFLFSRPIVPENDRAYVLSGLEAVSAVVLFEEETPFELIEWLEPDVLMKGVLSPLR